MTVKDSSEHGSLLSANPTVYEAYSGAYVDLLNPDPDTIHLIDIAHQTAQICRYNGSIDRHYSVAEHMVLVHDLLEWRGADWMILKASMFHDATEAYLGDATSPLKKAMRVAGGIGATGLSVYDVLSERMDRAIAMRFDFIARDIMNKMLVNTDVWACRLEARRMLKSKGEGWQGGSLFTFPNGGELPDAVRWHGGLSAYQAEQMWLARVRQYVS